MSDDSGTIYRWNSLYVSFVAQGLARTLIGLLQRKSSVAKLLAMLGGSSLVVGGGG